MANPVSPQTAQQLLKALEHDQKLALQLKTLLQEEKSSLEKRQYDAYQRLLKQKTQYLVELEQADTVRRNAMTAMGFSSDKEGFIAFIEQVPKSWQSRFQRNWESLSDLMNTCARLNKINGKILAHAQISLDRLMNLLRGNPQQIATYQSNGRHSAASAHRMLATA